MPVESDFLATARSLLNIEVNTILCDNMTAELSPPWQEALEDIVGWYKDFLRGRGVDLASLPAVAPGAAAGAAAAPATLPFRPLGKLAEDAVLQYARASAADPLSDRARDPVDKAAWVVVNRIASNCEVLARIQDRFQTFQQSKDGQSGAKYQPPVDDLGAIQKFWDLGTETIVAQTVVYLKGDVVTRVQPSLLDPKRQGLFAIHRESVDVSVANWHSLLDAVARVAGMAFGRLLGGK